MPHIVFRGQAGLQQAFEAFAASRGEDNGYLIKLQECYLASTRRTLLVEALAVRSGFSQSFYLLAEQKGATVTVRVDPHTNVEKNEGVKRAVSALARLVLAHSEGLVVERSNLPEDILASVTGGR